MVERKGIEPSTFALRTLRSFSNQGDSGDLAGQNGFRRRPPEDGGPQMLHGIMLACSTWNLEQSESTAPAS
jgi:hypothetical protein